MSGEAAKRSTCRRGSCARGDSVRCLSWEVRPERSSRSGQRRGPPSSWWFASWGGRGFHRAVRGVVGDAAPIVRGTNRMASRERQRPENSRSSPVADAPGSPKRYSLQETAAPQEAVVRLLIGADHLRLRRLFGRDRLLRRASLGGVWFFHQAGGDGEGQSQRVGDGGHGQVDGQHADAATGAERPGQKLLARRRHLGELGEGGTGAGKRLGEMVPAILRILLHAAVYLLGSGAIHERPAAAQRHASTTARQAVTVRGMIESPVKLAV